MGNKRKHSDCAEHITKSVSRAVSRAPLSRLVKAGSPEQYKSTCKEDDAIIIARPPPLKKARVTKPGDDIDIVQPAERSMLTKSQGRQKLISAYLMKEKEVESEEKKKTAKMAAYFSFLHKKEKIVKKKDRTVKKKEGAGRGKENCDKYRRTGRKGKEHCTRKHCAPCTQRAHCA